MEEEKLNEMYELTVENNRMLHAMRRNAMIGGFLKFVFWVIILVVLPYISWLYLQPYIQQASNAYQSLHGTTSTTQTTNGFDFSQIQKFFQQFGSTTGK